MTVVNDIIMHDRVTHDLFLKKIIEETLDFIILFLPYKSDVMCVSFVNCVYIIYIMYSCIEQMIIFIELYIFSCVAICIIHENL